MYVLIVIGYLMLIYVSKVIIIPVLLSHSKRRKVIQVHNICELKSILWWLAASIGSAAFKPHSCRMCVLLCTQE